MKEAHNRIFFVTSNNHKFKEVNEVFQDASMNFRLEQSKIEPIEIQAPSCKQVALYKLNSIKDKLDGSIFVEDAGFFVERPLNGFPGVYSSYVYKTIGNDGILRLIDDFANTRAYFLSVIALYFKPLEKEIVFEGKVEGTISDKIRGKQGFGFDPIFLPDINPKFTFAEISMSEKNRISHRSKALNLLIHFLKEYE